jgi:formylglycine-generating enzyme required for sulfatase activity
MDNKAIEVDKNFPVGKVFKDSLIDGSEGPNMVIIPAGNFLMGSPQSERGRSPDEGPQHFVTLCKALAIGRDPVTFDEYDRFALATGRGLQEDQGWGRRDRPVINVSWHDANAYADWLSQQTDRCYRLPTEAEWEYAARAGTTTAYWWGDSFEENRAHCASGFLDGIRRRLFTGKTQPVGSFPANPWGIRDTLGNVWEWTADACHDNYEGAPCDGSAWETGVKVDQRVLRGGSWGNVPKPLRSANRFGTNPDNRSYFVGFRLVRNL